LDFQGAKLIVIRDRVLSREFLKVVFKPWGQGALLVLSTRGYPWAHR
jgi:hypothetical protein